MIYESWHGYYRFSFPQFVYYLYYYFHVFCVYKFLAQLPSTTKYHSLYCIDIDVACNYSAKHSSDRC